MRCNRCRSVSDPWFLQSLFSWNLNWILIACYILVFTLACFVPREFLAVAFDSGGVTTGPITVPFIMALGVGLASVGKSEKAGEENNFGLIALCSVGPILSVLILGMIYGGVSGAYFAGGHGFPPCTPPFRCASGGRVQGGRTSRAFGADVLVFFWGALRRGEGDAGRCPDPAGE